ncbi:MAG: DUF3662 and FHA domain-containing protein, partial [Actinomycetes bacterium]
MVNGAFSKTFKSELQPVEISSAIKGEMDSKASIVSRDRILAPNSFVIRLASPDFNRMKALGETLIEELSDLAQRHAKKQRFQFGGGLSIRLVEDSSLPLGQVQVSSATLQLEVEWLPTLEITGRRYVLTKPQTSVGRDESADIQSDDSGLSRKHFEVLWNGERAALRDLGSTNGTSVNGRKVKEQA